MVVYYFTLILAIFLFTACGNSNGGKHETVIDDTGENCEKSATPQMATISLPKTGQITSYATGDDGAFQIGVAWPIPRFKDNSNGTITDNLTGLIWTADANAPGPSECSPGSIKEWKAAHDYVACLAANSYLGYKNWRLPNVNELRSLVNTGVTNPYSWLNSEGFTNVQWGHYWSSTSYAPVQRYAWVVRMLSGSIYAGEKTEKNFAWPVSLEQPVSLSSSTVQLPKTGQTSCYDSSGIKISCSLTGQDGDIRAGVTWPTPRFVINCNKTMTDKLTGLIWAKSGSTPGPDACEPDVKKSWTAALDHVTCLNTSSYLGYTDWRLPNVNELRSLVTAGESNSGDWLISLGFTNVRSDYYWTSTSAADDTNTAWTVGISNGNVHYTDKTMTYYAWPVRSGG